MLTDPLFSLYATSLVLAVAGAGIVALPWTSQEVADSWQAMRALGALPTAWLHPRTPVPVLATVNTDDLLPAPISRSAAERSRAARFRHLSAVAG